MPSPEELEGKYILLSARATPEKDGRFSAFCDELGLATCAESKEAAMDRLKDITMLVLNTATERGEILALLEGRAIRLCRLEVAQDAGMLVTGGISPVHNNWLRMLGDFSLGANIHSGYVPPKNLVPA